MAFPASIKKPVPVDRGQAAYCDAYDHVCDELHRLDLLIRRQILLRRSEGEGSQPPQFSGLVISDEEIDRILSRPVRPVPGGLSEESAEERHLLGEELRDLERLIAVRVSSSEKQGIDLPVRRIASDFGLARLEIDFLLICLAPEVDARYEKLYAYLQDDITRKLPTPSIIMDILAGSPAERMEVRKALSPDSPLIRHGLISYLPASHGYNQTFLSCPLRIDERIAGFLLGSKAMDGRIARFAAIWNGEPDLDLVTLPESEQKRLHGYAGRNSGRHRAHEGGVVLHFHGQPGTGRISMAKGICHRLGMPLLIVDVERMTASEVPFNEAVALLFREAALQPAAVCLTNIDSLGEDAAGRDRFKAVSVEMARTPHPVFMIGDAPLKIAGVIDGARLLSVEFPTPGLCRRKEFWEREGGRGLRIEAGVDYGALAGRFRFTPGQVRGAIAAAANLASWRHPDYPQIREDDLFAACRDHSNPRLCELARKIVPRQSWDDLVLPDNQLEQLQELCNQSKYRHIVYGDWGFDSKLSYGKGLSALFTGPPGTGKTMAAEVIANELQLDLYKIDLSQVVTKYIGETEKNLDRIFQEARTSNAILFFDEADALFGKRTEIKDAHDRYANIETGYLLQKIEEYEGIAILATNLRSNMDEAFVRRMHFIVEFPFPKERERRAIWERIWPEATPRCNSIDPAVLAKRFEISGGNIRNIALSAAFMAADDGGAIAMQHLLRAARREYQKMGKIVDDGEFEESAGEHPFS
jgi:AAA+ superfamily predicted ATPase